MQVEVFQMQTSVYSLKNYQAIIVLALRDNYCASLAEEEAM